MDQFYWLNTNAMFNLIGKNLDFLFQLDRSDGQIFVAMWLINDNFNAGSLN